MALVDYARIAKESVFNSRPAAPSFRAIRVLSEELRLELGFEYVRDVASRRFPDQRLKGGKAVRGPLNTLLRYDEVGELLHALLGKVATTQPDPTGHPNTYQHVFTPQDDPNAALPSYLLDLGVEGLRERRISGAWADQLTLSVAGAAEVALTWQLLAADEVGAAFDGAYAPGYSPLGPVSGADVVAYHLGAAAVAPEETQIVVNNNSPAQHAHGARTLPGVEFGELEVAGTVSLKFTSAAHLDDFLAESERSLTVTFRGPLIEGSKNYELTIEIPRISYDAGDAHINRQERKVQRLRWTALKPPAGDVVKFTLQNNVPGY